MQKQECKNKSAKEGKHLSALHHTFSLIGRTEKILINYGKFSFSGEFLSLSMLASCITVESQFRHFNFGALGNLSPSQISILVCLYIFLILWFHAYGDFADIFD